jgi:hypothetical protein
VRWEGQEGEPGRASKEHKGVEPTHHDSQSRLKQMQIPSGILGLGRHCSHTKQTAPTSVRPRGHTKRQAGRSLENTPSSAVGVSAKEMVSSSDVKSLTYELHASHPGGKEWPRYRETHLWRDDTGCAASRRVLWGTRARQSLKRARTRTRELPLARKQTQQLYDKGHSA